MTTIEKTEFEITNTCTCEVYDEETDTSTPSDYCYGCWEDEVENFKYCVLGPWLDANGWSESTPIHIEGYGMGWRRLSGYLDITAGKALEALSINGEYTLRFRLEGTELSASRYSHDEYGAAFRFTLAEKTEEEDFTW